MSLGTSCYSDSKLNCILFVHAVKYMVSLDEGVYRTNETAVCVLFLNKINNN